MPGDTSAQLISRLSKGPDLAAMKPLDLGGFAGAYLGGQEAGAGLKARRNAGEDLGAGDYTGGFTRGLLRGRAIQQETQDPAGAIKMKLLQQREQMGQIELQEALWRRDDAVAGRAAAANFLPVITNYIRSGQTTNPQVQQEVLNWLAANPEAFDDPRVKRQYELFNRSKMILQAEEAATRALQQPGAQESVKIGPEGGVTREIDVPVTRRAIPDKLEIADEMSRLQGIIANPNTSPTLKQQAENQLANIQAQMGTSSMEVLDPATGNTIMRQTTGRQPAAATTDGLTPANLTEVNKKIISTDIALHELDRAEDLIEKQPNAFGLRGVVGEAVETGRGVIDPKASTAISDARNQAAITFTQIADTLRVDSGNMSLYERRQLEKAGDITSWTTNPAAARGKISNVRNALVGGQLRRLQARGAKPKDALLRRIPSSEVPGLYDSGLLDDEAATRWRTLTIQNAQPK